MRVVEITVHPENRDRQLGAVLGLLEKVLGFGFMVQSFRFKGLCKFQCFRVCKGFGNQGLGAQGRPRPGKKNDLKHCDAPLYIVKLVKSDAARTCWTPHQCCSSPQARGIMLLQSPY